MVTRTNRRPVVITDPPIARYLFADTRFAWFWLLVRLYPAYTWLTSGWGKLNNPAWTQTGDALKGFWMNALNAKPSEGIYFDWYRGFIQFLVDNQAWTWFSKLIVAGELLVGLGLLLGAFTGLAAFFGAIMNWNYLLAGASSSNPVLLLFELFLVLAWKTAGWIGLDRFLLPLLGTPWKPGVLFDEVAPAPGTTVPAR